MLCACLQERRWHLGAILHTLVCAVIVKCCSNHWTVWSHRFLSVKLAIYQCLNVTLHYIGRKSQNWCKGLHLPVISRLSGPPNTPLLNTCCPTRRQLTITIRHFTHHQCWLTEVSNRVGYLRSSAHSTLVRPTPTCHMIKMTFIFYLVKCAFHAVTSLIHLRRLLISAF